MIEKMQYRFANEMNGKKEVKQVRAKGTILAVEVQSDDRTNYLNELRNKIYPFFIDRGILLRPLGNVMYVMPPYCIKADELRFVHSTIINFLDTLYD